MKSVGIYHLPLAGCNGCPIELAALVGPRFDPERFGVRFVSDPSHAEVLLVTGTVNRKLERTLREAYAAIPAPKKVIAVGACALTSGVFSGSYNIRARVDEVVPVDCYIPGCPPRPHAILYGIVKALDL